MIGAKIAVAASWMFAIGSFFIAPESGAAEWGRRLFWFLLVAHAIECAVFMPKLRKLPGAIGSHLVQTLIFGIVHLRSAEAAAAGSSST